jgi:hypothetical protein
MPDRLLRSNRYDAKRSISEWSPRRIRNSISARPQPHIEIPQTVKTPLPPAEPVTPHPSVRESVDLVRQYGLQGTRRNRPDRPLGIAAS